MALKPLTWHLNDFAGGIDTRNGQFSDVQNAFRELENYRLTNGKKIARRWPYIAANLTIPVPSQGIIPFAGALRTVQRREDLTGLTYQIAPLAFDTPDNCTAEWTLLDWAVFGTTVAVWIRHGYNSSAYPAVCRLHILNRSDQLPTYVEDPYCPSNWRGGLLPTPVLRGYDEDWTPRIVVAQGKAYVGDADGNVAFPKTGNLSAWNVKEITNLVESGKELAFVVPDNAATLKRWTISEAWEDFQLEVMTDKLRFTAYVLEWYDESTSAWQLIPEQRSVPITDKTYRLVQVTNRGGGPKPETRIELRWAAAASAIIRFRMILGERTEKLAGDILTVAGTDIDVATGHHQITKDGVVSEYETPLLAATTITDAQTWVLLDDTGVTTALETESQSAVALVHLPPTGYERWRNHILRYVRLNAGALTDAAMSLDEPWQAVRKVGLALYAGKDDAGVLNTSAHNGAGGRPVTAMAILRQRLVVWYERSSQLWQLGALAALHELIDTSQVGTGDQPTPAPAPLEDTIVVASPLGLRQFTIDSLQDAYIREIGIGDQLKKLLPTGEVPRQLAATYWPWTGQYVTAVTLGGSTFILAFDYAQQSKVAGWSKWTMRGFGAPDRMGMAVLDDRLYLRSGDVVRCFDASATSFRDVTDLPGAGNAYQSKAVFHFNDFKSPGTIKQALGIDVVQLGTAKYRARFNPVNEAAQSPEVTIPGTTLGRGKIPFIATGPALCLVLTSTDETGHELQSVAIELNTRRR